MDPGVRCHGMKANPTGYLWSKYECFLMSGCQDKDFLKTLTKWNRNGNGNGNGNAYDRGDYNSSFALRAVELKTKFLTCPFSLRFLCNFWRTRSGLLQGEQGVLTTDVRVCTNVSVL